MSEPIRGRTLSPGQQAILDEIAKCGTKHFGHLPAAEAPLIKRRRKP